MTLRDLRAYPQAFLFLVAFLIYNDGIGTIARMAAAYGIELGIGQGVLIGAILMVQFIGVPVRLSVRRPSLPHRSQARYLPGPDGICLRQRAGVFHEDGHPFHHPWPCLVGMVLGGSQALVPLPVRQHDSAPSLGRVFCLFRRFRQNLRAFSDPLSSPAPSPSPAPAATPFSPLLRSFL